ncbi:hypothetical protein [Alloyangia pacifica]|uniref:hypothetical protein n=1 Tax=Alloyangia pacifica TaxID=311180 RepID=UPI001CD6BD30|nr:hypothetical protein [Alloyangia pacifica]MCA0994491.1 hypothetical protein [Alloyangia pacifica]
MTQQDSRIFAPRSIALIGPVAELAPVIEALRAQGYPWTIWPVPTDAQDAGAAVAGVRGFAGIAALPQAPDLAFVALRDGALGAALAELAAKGAGAAVCPHLAAAPEASPLPVFPGGLLIPAERVALWPGAEEQAQMRRGVALLCDAPEQAERVLARARGLPLSYVLPMSGSGTTALHSLAPRLLADERVTALAVQTETLGDPAALVDLGRIAQQHGKALIFLSTGLGPGRKALLRRAGAAHVGGPKALVEALWILHMVGPLPANALSAMACAPGLAAQIDAVGRRSGLRFAALSDLQREALSRDLQAGVAASNPLDCAGLLNSEDGRLARVFAEMMTGEAVLSLAVVRSGARGAGGVWGRAGLAAAQARQRIGMPLALLALNRAEMTRSRSEALMQDGVIPLAGLKPALEALHAVIEIGTLRPGGEPPLMPRPGEEAPVTVDGPEARAVLGVGAAQAGDETGAAVTLDLRSGPSFGYLLRLSRPGGGRVSALLPLSPRARRDLGQGLGLDTGAQEALVSALGAVQDHVRAAGGAIAAVEADLSLPEGGETRAHAVRISAWPETDTTRRRSPE